MLPAPTPSIIERAVETQIRKLQLPPSSKILDAPCGAGALSSLLSKLGFEISGADIEPLAGSILGQRFKLADFRGALPWPSEEFDVVVSVEGIEHLENPHSFLREMYRVTRY